MKENLLKENTFDNNDNDRIIPITAVFFPIHAIKDAFYWTKSSIHFPFIPAFIDKFILKLSWLWYHGVSME